MKGKLITDRTTLVDGQKVWVESRYRNEPHRQFVKDGCLYENESCYGNYWDVDSNSIDIYEWIRDIPIKSKDVIISELNAEVNALKKQNETLIKVISSKTSFCPREFGLKNVGCSNGESMGDMNCTICWRKSSNEVQE